MHRWINNVVTATAIFFIFLGIAYWPSSIEQAPIDVPDVQRAEAHIVELNGRFYISDGHGWVWQSSFESKREARRALAHSLNKWLE